MELPSGGTQQISGGKPGLETNIWVASAWGGNEGHSPSESGPGDMDPATMPHLSAQASSPGQTAHTRSVDMAELH